MKPIILITGANGIVAKRFEEMFRNDYQIRYLSRNPKRENEFHWNVLDKKIDPKALEGISGIVHLAGAGIAEKRWSTNRQYEILQSRVQSAKLLLENLQQPIDVLVSASAIGYYGAITTSKIYKEEDEKGNDFLSDVVVAWENAADEFTKQRKAKTVVKLRLGAVLSKKGGALEKMKKPIEIGFGSALGTGKQWMPWVHVNDVCRIINDALQQKLVSGVYNTVASQSVNNRKFTESIAAVYGKKLWAPNVPSFVLKLILGEMSTMVLEGSRVSNEKLLKAGFTFQFDTLDEALRDLLD